MSPALASYLAYGTSGIRCGPALLRRHVAKDAIGEKFLFGIAGHVARLKASTFGGELHVIGLDRLDRLVYRCLQKPVGQTGSRRNLRKSKGRRDDLALPYWMKAGERALERFYQGSFTNSWLPLAASTESEADPAKMSSDSELFALLLQSKANSRLPTRRLFKLPRLRKSQCATTASRISTDSGTSPFGVRNGIDK